MELEELHQFARRAYAGSASELEDIVFAETGRHVIACRDPQKPGTVRLYVRHPYVDDVVKVAKRESSASVIVVPTDPHELLCNFIDKSNTALQLIQVARRYKNRFRMLVAANVVFAIVLVRVLSEAMR